MADIDIKQPAKINRNTAADGDFLWEKDFKVLYDNDEKLKNAIQQATQDYAAGDGIDIDPSTKTISVKTGTGIEKTEEGLSVNIAGVDGAKVDLEGNTFKVSAYNAGPEIEGLNDNLEELQQELFAFEQEAEEKYITSGDSMVPNHQYVYTTSGWADIGGEHATVSYWRPTYNESTGKLSWQMSPSIETPDDAIVKGDKGDDGDDGQTPEFRINQSTNFWEWKYTDEPDVPASWHNTNTSATGLQGEKGEQGNQGYTPVITHAVDTDNSGVKVTISWPAASQIPEDNFIIPSGTPGTNGTNGTNGNTPKLRVDSTTNRWQVSYDDGSTYTDISPATSATGPKGPKGDAPTIQATELAPTSEHTQGGVRWTIKYPEQSVSAIGDIWNGNNGTATVNCDGRWITGNGTAGEVIRPTTETLDALQAVSGKVNKPDTSLTDKYLALRTNLDGTVSGWCDLTDNFYSKSSSDNRYIQQSFIGDTLSGTGANAGNKLGVNTEVIPTKDWLDDNYLPLSGGTVKGVIELSGSTFDNAKLHFVRQTVSNTVDVGIGSNGEAVLKSAVPNNGYAQLMLSKNTNTNYPDVKIKIDDNGINHKVMSVPESEYNNMDVSANQNFVSGPNYTLAKTANGFTIGAALVNCTDINNVTLEANTYYFVYEV